MTNKDKNTDIVSFDPVMPLPVAVGRLKSLGEVVKAEADSDMLAELQKRLGILAVHAFSVEARVLPWKKNGVRIEGRVRGDIEQACVVSLKPVPEKIDESFTVTLLPAGSPFALRSDNSPAGGEMIIDPEGEDPPEEFDGDEVDVGRYAEEFFALALNDYPRAEGVHFSGHIEDESGSDPAEKPFSILAGMRKDLSKKE